MAIAGLDGDVIRFDVSNLAATTGYVALTITGPTSATHGSTLLEADFVFGAGATADEAHAQFVLDTTSGFLYFDADGTGSTAAQVAVAQVGSMVTADSILLVA